MEGKITFIKVIIILVFLAGCVGAPAPTPTPTPAATPAPKTPSPVIEGDKVEILISDYAKTVVEGETIVIGWKILTEKTAIITYTAIHYGFSSDPRSFDDQITPEDAAYRFSTHKYASGEYQVPNTFNVELIPNQTGTLFFRAYMLIGNKNYWTEEYKIEVMASPKISFISTPTRVLTGENLTVRWRITLPYPPSSFTTRLYYDTVSHPSEYKTTVTPAHAGYAFSAPNWGYDLEQTGSYEVALVPRDAGILYLRAHAEIDGKHYWSDERGVVVKKAPEVVVLSYPKKGNRTSKYAFEWRVVGGDPGVIEESMILFGLKHGNIKRDYIFHRPPQNGSTPRNFKDSFFINYAGVTVYFRAYAIVDGKEYYSDEYSTMAEYLRNEDED